MDKKDNKDEYGVIIETKKYNASNYFIKFLFIIGIILAIFIGIGLISLSNKNILYNDDDREDISYSDDYSEDISETTDSDNNNTSDSEKTSNDESEVTLNTNSEETQQNTVQTEFTPTEYKEYALNKVEELYDSNCFKYAGYYQRYSSNEIRLQFLFKNSMSNDEYKTKIKENTEKIYKELKDKYIKKEHLADSEDISIYFVYYIKDTKSVSNKKDIWSYSVHYIHALDKGNWPSIDSDYSLDI